MKKQWGFTGAGLLLGILCALAGNVNFLFIIKDGALALGQMLRAWSLAGAGGNAAAWGVCIVIALLPVTAIVPLRRQRRQKSDILWPLAGVMLFSAMYFLINPTLIQRFLPEGSVDAALMELAALLPMGAALSLLLSCLLMRWAGGLTDGKVISWMRILLTACMALTAFFLGFAATGALCAALTEPPRAVPSLMYTSTNEAAVQSLLIQLMLSLAALIPNIFFLLLLNGGLVLTDALAGGWFRRETERAALRVARLARWALAASLLTMAARNVLTLLLGRWLTDLSISISLPLTEMALSCGALLLARLLTAACRLQRDNELMI